MSHKGPEKPWQLVDKRTPHVPFRQNTEEQKQGKYVKVEEDVSDK